MKAVPSFTAVAAFILYYKCQEEGKRKLCLLSLIGRQSENSPGYSFINIICF